jgi:hypothetical protein
VHLYTVVSGETGSQFFDTFDTPGGKEKISPTFCEGVRTSFSDAS